MRGLTYTEAALQALGRVEPKGVRRQIAKKIETLAGDPYQSGAKKMRGRSSGGDAIFRIRVGDYRVLYAVRAGRGVIVLDVGHRREVYRRRR